jgi:hypothetical protein
VAATPVAVATAAAAGVAAATTSAASGSGATVKRNLTVPIVGTVGGSLAAVAVSWLARWAMGRRRAWAIVALLGVRAAMLAYAAQLSSVVHVTTQAVAYRGSVAVPKTYWIPYAGFAAAKGVRSTFRAPATRTKRLVGAQVGFAAQFVYMVLMGFAVFGPGWGVLALTAIGFLAYLFAYPWSAPAWGNNFRWWV